MNERTYILTIERMEANPKYRADPDRSRYLNMDHQPEALKIREVFATITEEEFDIIKQALLKVWK